jgi:hypothetical protein
LASKQLNNNASCDDVLARLGGKICRPCASALQRLNKLEISCTKNMQDALSLLDDIDDNHYQRQSRKRRHSDIHHTSGSFQSGSPDVSVSSLFMYMHIYYIGCG